MSYPGQLFSFQAELCRKTCQVNKTMVIFSSCSSFHVWICHRCVHVLELNFCVFFFSQTRKFSAQTVLNPQLWPWGEQLKQQEADQFVPLLKVSRLVTVDRQTKLVSFVWRSTVTSRETLSNGTNWSASRFFFMKSKNLLGERVNAHLPEYSTLKSFGIFSPKRFEPACSSSVVKKSIPAQNAREKVFQNFSVCWTVREIPRSRYRHATT